MKRHRIAALFLFFCGGLLTYTIYEKNKENDQ